MLKTGAFQGRGELEKVIEISLKAKKLNPKNEVAFSMLADDYMRLKRYDEAENILEEALKYYPEDIQFNIMYAQVLARKEVPLERIIPYLKTYLKQVPRGYSNFPKIMKAIIKTFDKKGRFEKLEESMNRNDIELEAWAQENIDLYEKDKT